MSGRPYTYGRGMAIAQLMRDHRRPVIKKSHSLRNVYLYGEDLFVSYSDTIDWVPKLSKLTRFGREECYIWSERPEVDGQPYISWGTQEVKPIEGWPTEEEIAVCIAESAEREKRGGGLAVNDITAMERLVG